MNTIRMILAALTLWLMAACNPSRKTISWKSGNDFPKKHTKILVLGFMPGNEMEIRENIEIKLEEAFRKKGVYAVSSLSLFGTNVFDRMDEEDVLYQLNNNCVDAVLTVTLLNRNKENKYAAGLIHYTPYSYYFDRFWRYRTAVKYRNSEPGYFEDMSSIFIECNLYDMVTQKLIYSVQSRSFSVTTLENDTDKLVRSVVSDFSKHKK